MPPERMARDVRHRFAVVFVAAVIAIVLAGVLLAIPGPWTERTIRLVPDSGSYACFFVNSTAHADRFCLALWFTPAASVLNGTFDHGPGTPSAAVSLCYGLVCESSDTMNETSATWTAPDGTGLVYWAFTDNVTLGAHT